MILCWISFLLLRINSPTGEFANLPKFDTESLVNDFIHKNEYSVVFYLSDDESYPFEFSNYAISKYKIKIHFAVATSSVSKKMNITEAPEIIGYFKGKSQNLGGPLHTTIGFSLWCNDFLSGNIKRISNPEELRRIFEGHKTVVIGVDRAPIPANFPKNEIFYEAPSQIFKYFNINVTAGIYVYRAADRQLVRAQNNYKQYTKTNVVDLATVNLREREYVGGYFVNTNNNNLTSQEIHILNKLGEKFNKEIYFAPFFGHSGLSLFQAANFGHFKVPFFAIMKSDNFTHRWGITNAQKMHDLEYLTEFIQNVIQQQSENTQIEISEDPNENDEFNIVNKNFMEKIISDQKDSFVLFMKNAMDDGPKIFATISVIQNHLKNCDVKFYFFDVSKNDVPYHQMSLFENNQINIPLLVMYPNGKEEEPIIYKGKFDFEMIVKWVAKNASNSFEIPQYDIGDVQLKMIQSITTTYSKINRDEL
ncbi:hypothetical protein TRFO_03535 [Tritrichomonas foetus]|uniref:Thioredoxin domain-containing protein n=1 Tax=Tritrichomonas foetus TaxID=1144522 RepID=A0A1J4KTV5_9EUKA|nr:hypothetical protein TRFO_03535 [Tritrichomonas foetus]|eukprot:OHT13094.1 hypothetical protein TRFO_03535 [Tritrichomonas foetus]